MEIIGEAPQQASNHLANLRKEMIQGELEDTRLSYHQLVHSIPDNKWYSPTSHPTWKVADILFHMILALRYLPSDIKLIRKIKRLPNFPGFVFHRWNDWNTRRGGRECTKASLILEYDLAHSDVINLINSMDPSEWTEGANYPGWDPMLEGFVTFEDLFHYPTRHFKAHHEELKSHISTIID